MDGLSVLDRTYRRCSNRQNAPRVGFLSRENGGDFSRDRKWRGLVSRGRYAPATERQNGVGWGDDVSSIFFVGGLEKYLVSHYRRQRAPATARQNAVGWCDTHSTPRDVLTNPRLSVVYVV